MNIELPESSLSNRGQSIRRLLLPIARQKGGPAHKRQTVRNEIIIGAVDTTASESNYRSWRFLTTAKDYRGMYFERWIQKSQRERVFYLDRAYLHIYRLNRVSGDEKEILCLHCDPNEPENALHARYKRGPHLHLMSSEQPFPHSHIALALHSLEDLLTSMDKLSLGLEKAILMIREQFLDPLA